MNSRVLCVLAIVFVFTACSVAGSNGSLPLQARQPLAKTPVRKASVEFRFKIPRERRRAHYISPGTKSIAVTVFDAAHAHQLTRVTKTTTPGASGCTAVSSGTFACSFTMGVPAGSDTFDVVAYDATGGTGPTGSRRLQATRIS